ncbi:hypothetical protein D3C74_147530 [compost metagenome]
MGRLGQLINLLRLAAAAGENELVQGPPAEGHGQQGPDDRSGDEVGDFLFQEGDLRVVEPENPARGIQRRRVDHDADGGNQGESDDLDSLAEGRIAIGEGHLPGQDIGNNRGHAIGNEERRGGVVAQEQVLQQIVDGQRHYETETSDAQESDKARSSIHRVAQIVPSVDNKRRPVRGSALSGDAREQQWSRC